MAASTSYAGSRAPKRAREDSGMPDVEVDGRCAGNAFAAAKRPRVGFGSGTKAWDGLSKPSAVLHDIFIDLLRSGLSVCSGSTLMAVVQRRCVGMDSRGVAVVGRRIADLVERLHESMLSAATEAAAPRRRAVAAARGDRRQTPASSPAAASGASVDAVAEATPVSGARHAGASEEEDDAAGGDPGSDSENSLNSEETADTEEAGFEEDFDMSEPAQPPAPRRPAAVPVLPRGGGLALKVGAPALPLLQMLLQQVAVLHAAMVDWESRHACLHAKAPGAHSHDASVVAPAPRS